VQAGLQVPPGFAVTGVKVCFLPGPAGSRVSGAQLFQFAVPPLVPPVTALDEAFAAPASSASTCIESTGTVSVDPSAGGPLYVSLGLTFTAGESVVIRGVGLHVQPVTGP
jgi:hypothetical protein